MKKYRKRPVVIEALQLTRETMYEIQQLPGVIIYQPVPGDPIHAKIDTLEGEMIARESDYVIVGVRGEVYPCKPDVFEATYESVENDHEQEVQQWADNIRRRLVGPDRDT